MTDKSKSSIRQIAIDAAARGGEVRLRTATGEIWYGRVLAVNGPAFRFQDRGRHTWTVRWAHVGDLTPVDSIARVAS